MNVFVTIWLGLKTITAILKKLWLDRCENLEDMSLGLKTLSILEYSDVQHFKKINFGNDAFDAFVSLKILYFNNCLNLKEVSKRFNNLTSL